MSHSLRGANENELKRVAGHTHLLSQHTSPLLSRVRIKTSNLHLESVNHPNYMRTPSQTQKSLNPGQSASWKRPEGIIILYFGPNCALVQFPWWNACVRVAAAFFGWNLYMTPKCWKSGGWNAAERHKSGGAREKNSLPCTTGGNFEPFAPAAGLLLWGIWKLSIIMPGRK